MGVAVASFTQCKVTLTTYRSSRAGGWRPQTGSIILSISLGNQASMVQEAQEDLHAPPVIRHTSVCHLLHRSDLTATPLGVITRPRDGLETYACSLIVCRITWTRYNRGSGTLPMSPPESKSMSESIIDRFPSGLFLLLFQDMGRLRGRMSVQLRTHFYRIGPAFRYEKKNRLVFKCRNVDDRRGRGEGFRKEEVFSDSSVADAFIPELLKATLCSPSSSTSHPDKEAELISCVKTEDLDRLMELHQQGADILLQDEQPAARCCITPCRILSIGDFSFSWFDRGGSGSGQSHSLVLKENSGSWFHVVDAAVADEWTQYLFRPDGTCVMPTSHLDVTEKQTGETALHKAATSCQRSICHFLVEAGASLMKTDLQGETPKQQAEKANDQELAEYLENRQHYQMIQREDQETAV
ncbi:diacylglycerol kinase zeta-like isoform X2 [Lates japonicus]|uniref:Diacylglycerol kinase zeta-like isoform X2 n=1 Tax=Lates japonicus TaxID=270547 RepID=A0AAD3MUH3_LATJO|nr:diacylglycerol kinase zeta-like isoform X2 [Lates japonicus]